MFLCSQDSSTWISQNRRKINMLKTLKLMFSAHFVLFTLIPMIIFTFYPCILNSVHISSLCSSLPLPKLFTCASWESLFCVEQILLCFWLRPFLILDMYGLTRITTWPSFLRLTFVLFLDSPPLPPTEGLRWGISLFGALQWASNPLSNFTIFEVPFLLLLVIICLQTIHWLTVPQCPREALASYFFNSGIYQWYHYLSFIIIWNQNLKSDILSVTQ